MDIEPIDTELWFGALSVLQQRRMGAVVSDLERQLRHAYHLQQLAPRSLRELVCSTCDEKTYETYLESGAYDLAARALVGHQLSYVLRIHGEHAVEAIVRLPGDTAGSSIHATNAASALLGAWLCCLQKLKSLARLTADETVRPATPTVASDSRPLILH